MAADSTSSAWTWSYIEMCARFGLFYSTPENTLLARPVNSAIPEEDLRAFNDLDPGHKLASTGLTGRHDTWHIIYASGDPSFFFDLCPYPLERVSWHRAKGNERLRTHSFQQLKKRFHDKSSSQTRS
tara:strand:- start:6085 stop:6465 length:381 start_codon:yes stop_codon:yes gene_type:complete